MERSTLLRSDNVYIHAASDNLQSSVLINLLKRNETHIYWNQNNYVTYIYTLFFFY